MREPTNRQTNLNFETLYVECRSSHFGAAPRPYYRCYKHVLFGMCVVFWRVIQLPFHGRSTVGFLIYTFTHAEQHQPPVVVERPQFCFSAHYMIYDLAYGIPYICVYYTMAQCDGEKSCLLRATRGTVEFVSHLSFALK